MHENVFTGTDASRVSSVLLRGGVEHRQIALLSYLRRRYPGESSGQFLAGGRAHRHEAPGRRRPFLQWYRTMTTSARRLPGVAERCLNQGGLGVSVPGAAQRTDPSQPSLPASGHQHARARRDLHRMAGTFNRLIPGTRIWECHNRINPR
jgi:hypothetical protein